LTRDPANPAATRPIFFICIKVKWRRWTMHWCRNDQLPSMSLLFLLLFLPLHVQTASNRPFLLIQAASLSFSQWLVVRYFLICSQPFLTQKLVSVIKEICNKLGVLYMCFFYGLTRVNLSDPWPNHWTGSIIGSGFKTMNITNGIIDEMIKNINI
jgi:hypothetical protein